MQDEPLAAGEEPDIGLPSSGGSSAAPPPASGGDEPAAQPRASGPPYAYGMRFAALAAAWLFPGGGHFLLRRLGRGFTFLLLTFAALATGIALSGHLYVRVPGDVFSTLGAAACMGLGPLYFAFREAAWAQGNLLSPWAEYGNRFVLLGACMNLLVILDAFDVALGRKEKSL